MIGLTTYDIQVISNLFIMFDYLFELITKIRFSNNSFEFIKLVFKTKVFWFEPSLEKQKSFYLRRFSESRSSSGSTPSVRNTLGCQVCVICTSKSYDPFLFKLCLMIGHILKVCTSYFVYVS